MGEHDLWSRTPRTPSFNGVDRALFETEIKPRARPAVLKGLVRDWPMTRAAAASPHALAALLKTAANAAPIAFFEGAPALAGRYSYTKDFKGFTFERRTAPLEVFLERLIASIDSPTPAPLYAGAVHAPTHLPGLEPAHPLPLLETVEEKLVSLWIGNRGRTPAHWDLPQNIACVVAGRRRFTLFPTDQVHNLYIGPLDVTIAGQPSSLVDFHAPDFDAFPRFREAMAAAEIADLDPGDALYLPSLWIHHVESLDPFGAMLNFWWREGPAHLVTPFFTLLHALLTLKGLPAPERKAWRALFDHFIFEENGDPFAHLPEHARGVFGEMTPERLALVRQRLVRTLQPKP